MILLGFLFVGSSKNLEAQSFNTFELRSIAKLINELGHKRFEVRSYVDEIAQYKKLSFSQVSIIDNQKKIIQNLETKIELIKPAWYDNFEWGFIGGLIVSLVTCWLFIR